MGLLSFWSGTAKVSEEKPDYYEEGLSLARAERFHEALTSLRLSLRERPGDVATLEQMGVVYTRMGMAEDAVKMYQRALEKDASSPASHYGLGFLFLNQGDEERAERHLDTFLSLPDMIMAGPDHVRHAEEALVRLRPPPPPPPPSAEPQTPAFEEDLELGL
ncbi:MAG: tetratricopeptide repeat protein [Gemmatimonadota bacterium]